MTDLPAVSAPVDRRAAVALITTAVALSLLEYLAMPWKLLAAGVGSTWFPGMPDLGAGVAWVAATTLLLVVVPAAVVRGVFGDPLASIGWSTRGFLRHVPVYLLLLAVMAPFVWWASRQPSFLTTYPFVASARKDLGAFVRWEAAYLFQFLAIEAFFRGYLLFSCERAMGRLAIFVAAVPYTMIHFHKPLPECLGAAGAGLVLGSLALRYRSFIGGVFLHAGVALAMDLLSVRASGLFG